MKIKKKKNKGFTLLELLAVIVILAVILIIAVPKIIQTIERSSKSALESTAKVAAKAVERAYDVSLTNGLGSAMSLKGDCMSIAELDNREYASCTYKINEDTGKAQVTIKGTDKGKFSGYIVKKATSSSATAVFYVPTAADTLIAKLDEASNGLEKFMFDAEYNLVTDEEEAARIEYRYTGKTPANYIKYNNEDWRIIGIFGTKNEDDEFVYQLKIMKNTGVSKAWDSGNVNKWLVTGGDNADIQIYLATDFYVNSLSSDAKALIDTTANFNINGVSNMGVTVYDEYKTESTVVPNGFTKLYNNPSANVGIMTMSDYGFAASAACRTTKNLNAYNDSSCTGSNWIHTGGYQWTSTASSYTVWIVNHTGCAVNVSRAYDSCGVRPVLYLISNIQVTGGTGKTSGEAYTVSLIQE